MKRKVMIFAFLIVCIVLTLSFGIGCKTETAATDEAGAAQEGGLKIALVVKNIGNPFFDAIKKGWDEAAAELGDESIFRGPEQPTPEGQIEIMEQLIAQKVDGITYVANDPQSIASVAKKAMDAGIAVVGWESGNVPGSRHLSVEPVDQKVIGVDQVK
ncbi:MAG: substrate-binding domain-containing protein, partial [Actinomycetota bacterium]|nr:substrate-binding domain-containing protein [Actinomycetota bacterium]